MRTPRPLLKVLQPNCVSSIRDMVSLFEAILGEWPDRRPTQISMVGVI